MTAVAAPPRPGPAPAAPERTLATATASGVLLLLIVVTAATLTRVFEGWAFFWPVVLPALAVQAVSILLRRANGAVAIAAGAVTVVLVSAWVYYRDTLRFGLPTRETLTTARLELDAAWQQVGTIVPPVPHEAGFGLAAALALGFAALLADAFAFRGKGAVEATVPSGVIFVAIAAVGADRNRVSSAAAWLVAAILAAVVLRAMHEVSSDGWIGGRTGGAWTRWAAGGLGLALVVGAAAAVVGPRLPGAGAEPLIEHHNRSGDSTSVVVNPLVDIRDRLLDPSNAEVFTVASDQPAYWRLTGLPGFDGSSWSLPGSKLREAGGQLNTAPEYSTPVSQQFVISRLRGAFAPVAYTPISLQASTDNLYFITDTSSMVLTDDGLRAGTSYDVVSAMPTPPVAVLAAATAHDPPDPIYLELPDGFAERYGSIAAEAAGGAASPYEQALNLQNWFHSTFTYSLDVPDTDGDELDAFLERRTGFCVHFATTFAAFARTLGLPARVAVGFTHGEVGADGRYIVRERNMHAWPEVWFDDVGWVLFEPTPGRGAPGTEAYTGLLPDQDESGPGAADTEAETEPTLSTAAPQTDPRLPGNTTPASAVTVPTGAAPASGGSSVPFAVWLVLALLLAAAAWVALMPRIVADRIGPADPEAQVARMWRSLVATARLVGVQGLDSKTALEQARTLSDATNIDRSDTLELARAATVAVYSPHGLTDPRLVRSREISTHLIRAVRSLLPLNRRILAHVDPRLARQLAGG